MASVSLQHIYKVYAGGVTAVSDFNRDSKDKEFIVLVCFFVNQKTASESMLTLVDEKMYIRHSFICLFLKKTR